MPSRPVARLVPTSRSFRSFAAPAGLALAIVLLLVVSRQASQRLTTMRAANRWVVHTHEVIQALELTRGSVSGAEAAARAMVFYDDMTLQPQFDHDTATAGAMARRVAVLVADNPEQARRAAALVELTTRRAAALRSFLEAHAVGGDSAAVASVRVTGGPRIGRALDSAVVHMRRVELGLLARRQGLEDVALGRLQRFIVAGSVVSALVALGALLVGRSDARRRARAEQAQNAQAAEARRLAAALEARNRELVLQAAELAAQYDLVAEQSVELETQNEALMEQGAQLARQAEALVERSEEAQRASEFLNTVLEHMADGVIAVGRDGAVTFCNRAAARLLNLPPDRPADSAEWARRHDLRSLGADGMDPSAESPFTRLLRGESVHGEEIIVARCARGRARDLAVTGGPCATPAAPSAAPS
jgi:CHASE3 domain sensor protein